MSELPYFPFYDGDFRRDTGHLTFIERSAYFWLLVAMWNRDGSVPDDDKDTARILGLSLQKWRAIKPRIMPFLTINESGDVTQKRLAFERSKAGLRIQTLRENGAKGGRPRANKNNDLAKAKGSLFDNQTESIARATTKPNQEERKHSPLNGGQTEDHFEAFWRAYPRREGDNPKKPARLAFDRAVKRSLDPLRIIRAAEILAANHPTPTRFIPQAVTWLNQDRWDAAPNEGGKVVSRVRTSDEVFDELERLKHGQH